MSVVLRSSNHETNWNALPKVRFVNKNFINENFLEHIESDLSSNWMRVDDAGVNEAWRQLQYIYNKVKAQLKPGMHEPGELDPKLILPVLCEVLGFHQRKKKFTAPNSGEQIEPDHLLFATAGLASKFLEDRSKLSRDLKTLSAICESKSWGLDLDIRSSAKELSPHEQALRDLRLTGAAYSILTNGIKWRLYSRESLTKPAHYFEMSLPLMCESEDPDAFEIFYNFFSLRALRNNGETSHVQTLQAKSYRFGAKLEKSLRIRMYSAVEYLLNGRYSRSSKDSLNQHYNASIMLMYRLLFILKAEDSALLPVRDSEKYGPFSLRTLADEASRMVGNWELGREDGNPEGFELFERLSALSRVIDKGAAEKGVPVGYNGGLFSESHHPEVFRVKIDNFHLANALFRCTRVPSEESSKALRVNFDSINYQHIGSVYEGLLEFEPEIAKTSLKIFANDQEIFVGGGTKKVPSGCELLREVKKGEAYLAAKEEARKNTGSYYTPQWVVLKAMELTGLTGEIEAAKTIQDLKKIKICDPAMGSGHFLVDAAELIIRRTHSLYVSGSKVSLQDTVEDVLLSTVFGADKNYLAVMLSRLNLWILLGARDRKLPSLDANLKHGNSLIYSGEKSVDSKLENGFNWSAEFEDVFADSGGFKYLIGNPPWGGDISEEKNLLDRIFPGVSKDNLNSFDLFVRQSIRLIGENGSVSFVLPRNAIRTTDYISLRKYIAPNLSFVADVGAAFDGVIQESVILGLSKTKQSKFKAFPAMKAYEFGEFSRAGEYSEIENSSIKAPDYSFNMFVTKDLEDIFKIQSDSRVPLLSSVTDSSRGIECGGSGELGKCPHCAKYITRPTKKKKNYKNCDFCSKRVTLDQLPAYNMISETKTAKHKVPIYSGRLIQKFSSENPRYIQLGLPGVVYKSKLFDGKPTIFMTKISDSLKCDIALNGEFATQGVYTLKAKSEDFPLVWVAAFINSELGKFFHEYRYNVGAFLTTNVLLDHIKNMRCVVPPNAAKIKSLQGYVNTIKKFGIDSTKGAAANEQIDSIIYEAFGVTKRQIMEVRAFLEEVSSLKEITVKQLKTTTADVIESVDDEEDNEVQLAS